MEYVCKALKFLPVFLTGAGIFSLLDIAACRDCCRKGRLWHPGVAAGAAAGGCFALLCLWRWELSWQSVLVYAFLAVLQAVACIDRRIMKIPNSLVLAAGVLGILSIPFFPGLDPVQRGLGTLSVSVPMFMITLIAPGAFGGGDIKLMAACGLFLGWEKSIQAFAAAVLAAGAYCICMLAAKKLERKSKFAFGPFLCLGMAVTIWLPIR